MAWSDAARAAAAAARRMKSRARVHVGGGAFVPRAALAKAIRLERRKSPMQFVGQRGTAATFNRWARQSARGRLRAEAKYPGRR